MEDKFKETFVFNGKEVFLTGRRAVKKTRRSDKILYEVKQKKYGLDGDSQWVSQDELFIIEDINSEVNIDKEENDDE